MEFDKLPVQSEYKKEIGQGFNLKEILFKYLHYAWLFIVLISVCLFLAWLNLRYTAPKYSVSGTLLIRNDNNSLRGGSSQDAMFMSMMLQPSNNKQNEIEILKSRSLMARVVRQLGLQVQYYVVGNVMTRNIYTESPFEMEILQLADSSRRFGFELHFSNDGKFSLGKGTTKYMYGEELVLPEGKFIFRKRESAYSRLFYETYIVNWAPELDVSNSLLGGLNVKPSNDLSNVLLLTYVTENPKLGAAILNTLMTEYNTAGIEDKNEINRRILTFLDERLGLVENQLDSVERDLQRFKTSREVIDLPAQSQFYIENLGSNRQNIQEQEIQLQVAELLSDYIKNPKNKNNLVPSTLGLSEPILIEQVTAYNKLVVDRVQQVQTGATQGNPVVQNLDNDIEEARLKILKNLDNIKTAFSSTIGTLKGQQQKLQSQILSVPEKEKMAREKARQQEIKQNLYLYLLQKREESNISLASTISTARVVDPALAAGSQISPKKFQIYLIAFLAGILIPVVIIYLIDLFNDKVTTRSDIEKATQAPILGEIGHNEDQQTLVFNQLSSRSVVAEQLRILRSNLNFLIGEKFNKPSILITSSFGGEGKSFVSTNLGAAMALTGKKTVILEFDLRKPKILAGLGLQKGHGLTNYLVGAARIDELPHKVPGMDNLYVVPCGPVPPNPSEILLTSKITELFEWLRREFDVIVIDTAPVGLVSDALSLSQYADATLYVVRQRYTFKRQLLFINELYVQGKLPKMGLLVNDVVSKGSKGYYGYGGGRYGYGYGYGYGKTDYYDDNNRSWYKRLLKGKEFRKKIKK